MIQLYLTSTFTKYNIHLMAEPDPSSYVEKTNRGNFK